MVHRVWIIMLFASYVCSLEKARLSLADWGSYHFRDHKGPGTYAFGYDIEDAHTSNTQFRQEERHANGTVTGSYGFVDADGTAHIVHYTADHRGFRVQQETPKIPNYNQPQNSIMDDDIVDDNSGLAPIQFPTRVQQLQPLQKNNYNTVNKDKETYSPVMRKPIVVPFIYKNQYGRSPWSHFNLNINGNSNRGFLN